VTPVRTRLVTCLAGVAVLGGGAATALVVDWSPQRPAPVAAAPAQAIIVPQPVAPAPTTPAGELPPTEPVATAMAAAKADTGVAAKPFIQLKVPSWAVVPTEARHHAVRPVGQSLTVAASAGGPVARTYQKTTVKDAPLALLELARQTGPDGAEWVKVLLPERPNGTFGWVKAADTRQTETPWSVDVHQAQHQLLVWYGKTLVKQWTVAVGAPATFTPNGLFFVDVVVNTGNPGGAYGKWIVGLNGFSEVYDQFGDGDALIGIHGTNVPSSLGKSVSHGCVRSPNPEVATMARLLPLGTPVHIRA
jgi:hypothetical protein